jgi:CHAT domain-containing protein
MSTRIRILAATLVLLTLSGPLAAQESPAVSALQSKGQSLLQQGQAAAGIKAFEDAVELAKKEYGPDDVRTFVAQGTLAQALQAVGRFNEAVAMCKNYVSGMEAKFGPDHVQTCSALVTLGRMHTTAGGFADAVTCLTRALKGMDGRIEPDQPAFTDCLEALISTYINMGRAADAEPHLRRKIQISEAKSGLEHPDLVSDQIRLMILLQNSGRLNLAEEYIERSVNALKARVGMDHVQTARLLDAQAQLKVFRGRHAEAEPLLDHAKSVLEKALGPDAAETCKVYCTLGELYRLTGRPEKAEPLLRHNLKMTVKRYTLIHPDSLEAHQRLSKLLAETGRLDEARTLLQDALDATVKVVGPDHPIAVSFRGDLNVIGAGKGRNNDAPGAMARTRRENEKAFGKGSPITAIANYNEAATLVLAGRYAEAEQPLKESLEGIRLTLGADHPAIGAGLGHLCHVYDALGRYKDAEEYARRTVAFYDEKFGPEHPETAASREILATSLLELNRGPEALEQIDLARHVRRRILDRTLPVLAEDDQISMLQARFGAAFVVDMNNALSVRNDSHLADLSASWILNHKAVANSALAERAILSRQATDARVAPIIRDLTEARRSLAALTFGSAAQTTADAESGKKFAQLVERERELSRQLGQALNRPARDDPWVPLAEVRQAIPSDAVLIEFAWYESTPNNEAFNQQINTKQARRPGRYVAWVIPPPDRGTVRLIDLGDSGPIDNAIAAVRIAMQFDRATYDAEGEPEYEKRATRPLNLLSRSILGPLRAFIDPASRWVVSPDAALWLVPWQALPLGDGIYAVERHLIHLVVSGRDLASPAPVKSKSPPIVFADPDFNLKTRLSNAGPAPTRHSFARLPYSRPEADGIREPLHRYAGAEPIIYTDVAATESQFRKVRRPRALILSTHGFFLDQSQEAPSSNLPVNPLLRCGMVLAGANVGGEAGSSSTGSTGEDGILTGLEIVGVDLTGTDVVVLSACETGLGKVQFGEGVAGLRQAFQLAGAQAVVASLWSVPDGSTANLMIGFFKQLSSGLGPASALRNAQLEAIENHRSRFGAAHPYFWAAFALTGGPGPNWASEPLGTVPAVPPAPEVAIQTSSPELTRGRQTPAPVKTADAAAPKARGNPPATTPSPAVIQRGSSGSGDPLNPFVEGALMIVITVCSVTVARWWWLKGPQAGV